MKSWLFRGIAWVIGPTFTCKWIHRTHVYEYRHTINEQTTEGIRKCHVQTCPHCRSVRVIRA